MQKLSVCMIVKNESQVLERCLKKVKKFADEIVIVDTGSSDNTKEIAKKFTPLVLNYDWNKDFSAARNFAFKNASGKYLMWIDADDVVDDENVKKIIELKKHLTADTYMVKYQIAFDEKNNPTFEYYRERIVRNTKQAKFCGFVHEVITPFGQIEYTDIAIKHQKPKQHIDAKRNLNLYRYHIKNGEKLSAREMFYYARELYYNGYYVSTIVALKKYLKMENKFFPNEIDAYVIISDCYLYFNDTKNSKKYLLKSLGISAPNALICCKLGNLCIKEKDYRSAIFWFKSALLTPKALTSGAFIENEYYDFLPYLQLSFCHYQIGDHAGFVKYHNLAKAIKPNDKSILNNQKYV